MRAATRYERPVTTCGRYRSSGSRCARTVGCPERQLDLRTPGGGCLPGELHGAAREANRLHEALEDTGIKLGCVATDILGKSGRLMLDALIASTTDPEVLAALARGRLRAKIPALREALAGRFDICTRSGSARSSTKSISWTSRS